MSRLHTLSASETIALVRSGSLTCVELVDAHLARIDEREAQVQAWVWLDPSAVRAEAKKMDQLPEEQRGPLHGMLIGVKDIVNVGRRLSSVACWLILRADARYADSA